MEEDRIDMAEGDYIFCYGSLAPGKGPFEEMKLGRFLVNGSRSSGIQNPVIIAALYEPSEKYPGVKLEPQNGTKLQEVKGLLFQIKRGLSDEKVREFQHIIDDYEKFIPGKDVNSSLFLRKKIEIKEGEREVDAWIYEYNKDVDESTRNYEGVWRPTADKSSNKNRSIAQIQGANELELCS